MNLEGIKIGNRLLDDVSDTRGAVDFAWSHALVSKDTRDEFLLSCAFESSYEDEACSKAYETLLSEIGASNGRIVRHSSSKTRRLVKAHNKQMKEIHSQLADKNIKLQLPVPLVPNDIMDDASDEGDEGDAHEDAVDPRNE
uniref:Serine carboxypeptidase II-1 n=1 Tax=Tanacetum cinerariifolium TaxID=118510 RepID=A0A6L2M861_TANCI|nr:serine carboxypeptidase II-1 [Tanacetum cinerariifolium]